MRNRLFLVTFLVFVLMFAGIVSAQQFVTPAPSPGATVSQVVGITDIKISYSRPGVKNRTIWGELVPYDKLWRTGANRCTLMSFSKDVLIQGNTLKAGEYSLFTIPGTTEWSVVFNSNTTLNGAFGYKEEEDVLRIKVKPRSAEFKERMSFNFENIKDNATEVVLHWEKLQVPFNINIDTDSQIFANANSAINWQTPNQAASYCLQAGSNLEDGLRWATISIAINENYNNTGLKARLQAKLGQKKDAIKTLEKAIELAQNMERKPRNLAQTEELLAEWKK